MNPIQMMSHCSVCAKMQRLDLVEDSQTLYACHVCRTVSYLPWLHMKHQLVSSDDEANR